MSCPFSVPLKSRAHDMNQKLPQINHSHNTETNGYMFIVQAEYCTVQFTGMKMENR